MQKYYKTNTQIWTYTWRQDSQQYSQQGVTFSRYKNKISDSDNFITAFHPSIQSYHCEPSSGQDWWAKLELGPGSGGGRQQASQKRTNVNYAEDHLRGRMCSLTIHTSTLSSVVPLHAIVHRWGKVIFYAHCILICPDLISSWQAGYVWKVSKSVIWATFLCQIGSYVSLQ